MVDVFISYARANRDMVRRLAEAIGALGYVVWWDEELPAHLTYGDVITQKIGEAKATLVVWSAESAASEWVRAEADMARNQKTLIQTSIDGCMPPMPFNQIQYASIGDWAGEADHPGWRKARASLAALCGPAPAESAPLAPEPAAPPPLAAAAAPSSAPVPKPRLAPPARSHANRIAFITIAASAMALLTVGGLVLLKGPPSARAAETAAPAPAPAPAPVQLPPKTVVDVPAQPVEEAQDEEAPVEALDPRDDF